MNGKNCLGEQLGQGMNNLFVLGDAVANMSRLIESYAGQVQLIYLDPPFQTGSRFTCAADRRAQARLRFRPLIRRQHAPAEYYAMMGEVLSGCRELLSDEGSLFLHIDPRTSARLRIMLDGIFGEEHFVNEIIWHYKSGGRAKTIFRGNTTTSCFTARPKTPILIFPASACPGARICKTTCAAPPTRRAASSIPSNPAEGPIPIRRIRRSILRTFGRIFPTFSKKDPERTGYDTQKPEALLKRIILSASRPNDLVMDLFSGSGTTASAAAKFNRRFVAMDSSPIALSL